MNMYKMSKDNISPVVLFVYNRPEHTRDTLRALSCSDFAELTRLYIYSDGPKNEYNEEELKKIKEVRDVIREKKWCGEVIIIESDKNKGLAESIINGVTEVINLYGKIIVLEDDIRVSKGFLKYCNEALEIYGNDERVMHISASMYDVEVSEGKETFFLKVLSCHGWATWKRAWDKFNNDALDHFTYFHSDKKRLCDFDVDGNAYFMKQLRKNVTGELKSQAVLWYASWLRNNGLSLFPKKSLIYNTGFDGTGENFKNKSRYYLAESVDNIVVERRDINEDYEIREKVGEYWRKYLHDKGKEIKKQNVCDEINKNIIDIVKKIIRKIVVKSIPEIAPIINNESALSWAGVVSNIRDSNLHSTVKIFHPVSIKYSIIAKNTYINQNANISYTQIGKYCSIGPNFKCGWGIHPTDAIATSPIFYSVNNISDLTLCEESKFIERKKITIGNDVFIGMNVIILDGVKIGDGAIIGAGCVVSKDVPPYAVAVGCPMKIIRKRFNNETIDAIIETKWWDWDEEKIREVADAFYDVDEFIEKNSIK